MGRATDSNISLLTTRPLSHSSSVPLPSLSSPETQDTCLSNNNEGEGEREDTRYQVQDELVARVHKRHSVKIPEDEENSAAGAGIFSDDDEMDG